MILTTSDYFSGIHLTVFLCLLSIYLLVAKNKPVWSGIVSVLALLVRFYAAPIVLALIIFILFDKNKHQHFWGFILSSGALFIGVNLVLYLIFKQSYFQDVIIYHLLKFEELDKMRVFNFFLRWDWLLLIWAGLSILIVRQKEMLLPLLAAAFGGIFLYFFKDIYYLYFNLILPFLAVLAGLSLGEMLKAWASPKSFYPALVLISVFLLLLSGYNTFYYLQNHAKAARIGYLQDLNRFILENSGPKDKIYGSFEIAPLVAALTKRPLANNFIDTNDKTFSTGLFDLNQREKILKQEKVKFILTKVLVGQNGNLLELGRYISFNFLKSNCRVVKKYPIYKDYYSNLMLVWKCNFE